MKTYTFQLGQAFGQVVMEPSESGHQIKTSTIIRTGTNRGTKITSRYFNTEREAIEDAMFDLETMGATNIKEYDLSKFENHHLLKAWFSKCTEKLQR